MAVNASFPAQISHVDNCIHVVLLESRWSSTRSDNEPWRSIDLAIQQTRPETVCLDLGNVTYLSSDVLGKIVGIKRRFQGAVLLCNVSTLLREIFRVTGLSRILVIWEQE